MTKLYDTIRPVKWESDRLMLLDQRLLPEEEEQESLLVLVVLVVQV